jgi:pectinesterase
MELLSKGVSTVTIRRFPAFRFVVNVSLMTILVSCCSCSANARTITVATEGKCDFHTIQEAIATIPDSNTAGERTIIRIMPGKYLGPIFLPKTKQNVTFEGTDAANTVITYGLNVYETEEIQPMDKVRVPLGKGYRGTGVVIMANGFTASNVTFENTSGDHGQALALRIDGDRAVLRNCRLLGWQDTVMLNKGRQYFRDCYIEGRVDFIYGSATAVFDNCEIHSKNGGHLTAASTPQDQPYGFVFINCRLTGDPTSWKNPWAKAAKTPLADLGRPWRPYASVTYINCRMGDHINPVGWNNWGRPDNEKTARYSEYDSRTLDGKPLDVSKRLPWSEQLSKEEAEKITTANIFKDWDPSK